MTSATPVNNHMGRRVDDDQGAYCADGRVRTGVASGSLVQTDPTPCSPVTGEADKPASLKSVPSAPRKGGWGVSFQESLSFGAPESARMRRVSFHVETSTTHHTRYFVWKPGDLRLPAHY